MDDGMILNNGTVSCVDSGGGGIVRWHDNKVDLIGTANVSLGQNYRVVFLNLLKECLLFKNDLKERKEMIVWCCSNMVRTSREV